VKIIPLTWHHALWIPCVIAYYIIYSWLSKMNNGCTSEGTLWYQQKWLWYAFIFGALCPFWIIVSRISKNLLFDGMLYDNIMFLTYVVTMAMLGSGCNFKTHQWLGVLIVIIGSILMRIERWS